MKIDIQVFQLSSSWTPFNDNFSNALLAFLREEWAEDLKEGTVFRFHQAPDSEPQRQVADPASHGHNFLR